MRSKLFTIIAFALAYSTALFALLNQFYALELWQYKLMYWGIAMFFIRETAAFTYLLVKEE